MITAQALGRLTRDPETKTLKNGTITVFTVASTNRGKSNDEQPTSTFVNCSFWGPRGETFAKFHKKGQMAFVWGELFERSYEGANGPGKSLDMTVSDFGFPESRKSNDSDEEAPAVGIKPTAKTSTAPRAKVGAKSSSIDDYDPFAED